jgi:hypothetical protein
MLSIPTKGASGVRETLCLWTFGGGRRGGRLGSFMRPCLSNISVAFFVGKRLEFRLA